MANQAQSKEAESLAKTLLNKSIVNNIVPLPEDCIYTPFYCEENVWHLCDYVRKNKISEMSKCYVVFISNNSRCVPLWRQRSGKDEERLVTWNYSYIFNSCVGPINKDYHVIFMYCLDDRCLVFDLDSDLPFPTYFHKYVTETIRTDHILRPENHRFFRVIPASVYLQKFASDRRHMRQSNGKWLQHPPKTPLIRSSESLHNLDDFISMDPKRGFGSIHKLQDFVNRFYKNQRPK